MKLLPDFSTFISIFGVEIKWYAVFILTGAFIAYRLFIHTIKKWGYKEEEFENYFILLMLFGILGARIWYVIFEWQYYIKDPISVFDMRSGGLAIHGGIFAGLVFSYLYFKKRNVSFLRMVDAVMPHVLLAQAFGRWGNFFNQEAFGGVVSEAYYTHFPAFIKDHMLIAGEYRQPTFLFESIANVVGWALIYFVFRKYKNRRRGDLGFAYLTWYGITRFVIEGMRTDSLYVFGTLRTAQLVSIAFVVIGCLGLMGVIRKLFKNTYIFRKNKPIILFDLDGTLLDTHELITQSYIATFKKFVPEYTVTQEDIDGFAGPTLEQTFSRFTKDAKEIEEWILYYREWNHQYHDDYVEEVEQVKHTLDTLKEQGYTMGVVSNKPQASIALGVDLYDLRKYFEVIVGCYDTDGPKPNPCGLLTACEKIGQGHDDLVYVGDAITDIQASKNMGAFSVAFILDKKYEESMRKENPCRMIYNMNELIEILKEDVEWNDNTIS